ncbi:MAG: hypothetical protein LBT99_02720 [Bifidobacteriaceae bacterium]|jgi:N-acetylglucosamine-6-phosphate deacetylase|nr:hypothetical protein [Bifidobacteriaceae bacterium]
MPNIMIDNHFHGGGGLSNDSVADRFIKNKTDGLAALDIALAPHKKSGTKYHILSLVTSSRDKLLMRVAALSEISRQRDDILGIHLEANFISPLYKGAHNIKYLSNPDIAFVKDLIDTGDGQIAQITLAPELDGGIKAIEYIKSRQIVASIGHTDANYEQTWQALESGASNFTHLFNAMGGINHRQPGPIMAARDWYKKGNRLTVEIINDGWHIADSVVKLAFDLFSDYKTEQTAVALVTDAMEATGMPDGNYKIGDLPVLVKNRKAKINNTDTIAGSTLTLGAAAQRAKKLGLSEKVIKNSLSKKILVD